MKTIYSLICAAFILAACTNAGRSGEAEGDTLGPMNGNSDPNNRNTTVFDSTSQDKDTASYERMPQVKTDSGR